MARKTAFHNWMPVVANLLFPPECTFCRAKLENFCNRPFFCANCRNELTRYSADQFCLRCGIQSSPSEFAKCPECQKRRFVFDRVVPLGAYTGLLRQAVIRIKNFSQFPLASSIGNLMADRIQPYFEDEKPDVVLPIPKHWLKRIVQGTNSADFLAEEIAKKQAIPYHKNAIWWNRYISKQSLLSATERRQNVRGALELTKGFDFQGAHILLVDDTMTTGSTANEASRCLKKAGASHISVAIVGRAFSA